MFRSRLVILLLGASLSAPAASAQERRQPTIELTFPGALALAREQAADLTTARARANVARSALGAASIWTFNPQLEASAGPRFASLERSVDWSVGARQWLELGGQRGDRMAAARAELDAAEARAEDAERLVLREVGLVFARALYWRRQVELAGEDLRIAEEIARVARRRHEVGDVGGLEESVASLALERARIGQARAIAARHRSEGRLKMLLGLGPEVAIVTRGELRQLGLPPAQTLDQAPPADAPARADIRALEAEIRGAEAEAELGRAHRVPDLALGASFSREESASILSAGVTVSLPFFDRGQGTTAVASARRAGLAAEREGVRRSAAIEVQTAAVTSQQLAAAAGEFEAGGLATLERAERVATASYQAGAMPLGELLAVRRELVQARADYTDLLLAAATARVELLASTGGFE